MLFSVTVRVPGSSANLGPGFDCLGLALTIYDEWTLELPRGRAPALEIEVDGSALDIPRNGRNLAYRAAREVFRRAGKKVPAMRLRLRSQLPMAGGLGSSSAAIVGGLVAANAALGNKFSLDQLVDMASKLEGHPDNVTPALAGGLCASALYKDGVSFVSLKRPAIFKGMKAVVCIPQFALATKKARAALPKKVSHGDAVFNVGRAVGVVLGFSERRWDVLGIAMEDRLHEPYRRRLIPGFDFVKRAARRAGALGTCLSGAGPTVLALAPAARAASVGRAMEMAFRRAGLRSQALALNIDTRGAAVTRRRK